MSPFKSTVRKNIGQLQPLIPSPWIRHWFQSGCSLDASSVLLFLQMMLSSAIICRVLCSVCLTSSLLSFYYLTSYMICSTFVCFFRSFVHEMTVFTDFWFAEDSVVNDLRNWSFRMFVLALAQVLDTISMPSNRVIC